MDVYIMGKGIIQSNNEKINIKIKNNNVINEFLANVVKIAQ